MDSGSQPLPILKNNKDFVGNKLHHSSSNNDMFSSRRAQAALVLNAALACSFMLWGSSALAWGFGEMRVLSALSEPFRTQIDLIGSDVANVEKNCFKAHLLAFDGAPLGAATVTFRENSHSLLITTRHPVNEPAAALTVSYTCTSQMQREYAILLDLPITKRSASIVPAQRDDTVAMPSSAYASNNATTETAPVRKTRRAVAADASTGSDPNSNPAQTASAAAAPARKEVTKEARKDAKKDARKAAEPQKNVLRLGQARTEEDGVGGVFRQRLGLSYSLAAPPVESDVQPDAAAASQSAGATPGDQALQQLLNKISALERKTEALQKLNAEQLNALDEARKTQTPAGSMYVLYVLLLACALAIGWLVWRMRQVRSEVEQASWRDIVPGVDASDAEPDQDRYGKTANAPLEHDASQREAVSQTGVSALASPDRKSRLKPKAPLDLDDPFAGMSVVMAEEILDEIQEAEFWVHMNQPQRAISILESEAQPASPLKWLHLFDLYRMVGDREKYESLAARFKHGFNGRVASWERYEEDKGERSIEEFPHVMKQIMDAWPTDGLVGFLEELLLDNREGNRLGFDLPAYQDLLFLANIAYQVRALRSSERAVLEPLEWPAPGA